MAGSGSPERDGAEIGVVVEDEAGVVGVGDGAAAAEGDKASPPAPPAWAPRWAVEMHPAGQAAASVGLYMFHMVREGGRDGGVIIRVSCCCFCAVCAPSLFFFLLEAPVVVGTQGLLLLCT